MLAPWPTLADAAARRLYDVPSALKFGIRLRSGEIKIPVVACYLQPNWQATMWVAAVFELVSVASFMFPVTLVWRGGERSYR